MRLKSWQQEWSNRILTSREALSRLENGQTIFVGSGAAEPLLLTDTLSVMATEFWGLQVIHLTSVREKSKLAGLGRLSNFRYKTFHSGKGTSDMRAEDAAEMIPMDVRELPQAMASGAVSVDVALVQVSPPDSFGLCSLGVSVDATKAAVENARLVIAQVNKYMPVTLGDSLVRMENIDIFVESNVALPEIPSIELDPVSLTIGRHIASLVKDGMTLHFDRGPISDAAMRYLDTKKDLGIHTDILTDSILRLSRLGAVTNRKKNIHRGKTIATMAVGSEELYQTLNYNPYFELLPIDEVNDPVVISRNDNMVSIHSVQEIDLTGLARIDPEQSFYSHDLPSSMNFVDGASRSKGGLTIVALPSTTQDGKRSHILAESISQGVALSRVKIDYVVTEYGIVSLYGRSIRERAIGLISIAHPKFRRALLDEAKDCGHIDEEYQIPPAWGCIYPQHYEFSHTLNDGTEMLFRPVKPTDARALQQMFYSLSPESRRLRYHGEIKALSNQSADRIATVDYSKDMAIVAVVSRHRLRRIVAEGRYTYNPVSNMGEFDIVVADPWCRLGIGAILANYLKRIAYSKGLSGMYAEVISRNAATIALLDKTWPTSTKRYECGTCIYTLRFPEEDVKRPKDSIIIYSGRFADYSKDDEHHFDPDRPSAGVQLIKEQGYLGEPWMRIEEPKMIAQQQLAASHDPKFVNILREANSGQWNPEFARYHIGDEDTPVFRGLFDYVLLYSSATATAVEMIMYDNANVVFSPLGGFHHASRNHAEAFCYVNDVIIAIDMFLSEGFRVAYLNFGAHHGKGVQEAYYADDRVLCISLHEKGSTFSIGTGLHNEIGEGRGRGYTLNVPLPEGTDDEAYGIVVDKLLPGALEKFAPSVLLIVPGADTHKSDPCSRLCLTNNGLANAVARVRGYSNHMLILGGGGSNISTVTRAWCRVWAAANRMDALPDYMLTVGGSYLGNKGVKGAEIVDMSYRLSGEKKEEIIEQINQLVSYHETHTLSLIEKAAKNGSNAQSPL